MDINILVICGSVQNNNFSLKTAKIVVDELQKQKDVSVELINPATIELTLPGKEPTKDAATLQEKVKKATGVIFVGPEYHGSYSSVTKLIIDNLGFPSTLKGKPIALVGVAAGVLGAIKSLEHLRSVLSHVGAIVLPSPSSLAGVHELFNEDGSMKDGKTESRLRKSGVGLVTYINDHICPKIALEEMSRSDAKE